MKLSSFSSQGCRTLTFDLCFGRTTLVDQWRDWCRVTLVYEHSVEALPLKETGFLPREYSDTAAPNLQTVIDPSGSGTWPRTPLHATFLTEVS